MDSSVSPKDEIWFLRVYHHISSGLYICNIGLFLVSWQVGYGNMQSWNWNVRNALRDFRLPRPCKGDRHFRNATRRKLLFTDVSGPIRSPETSVTAKNQRFVISQRYMNARAIFVPPVLTSCSESLFSLQISSLSLAVLIWWTALSVTQVRKTYKV